MAERNQDQTSTGQSAPPDFIRARVAEDLRSGKHDRVVTRFPPEPNGHLHIGHAKAMCLNFGVAAENPGGVCHLRFDDTNPLKEDAEFEDSIQADVRWLGFDWKNRLFHASDYFEQLYDHALTLIRKRRAYVCSLNAEAIREYRGTLTEPGRDSPYRDRSVEENLDLFGRMRAGEFAEGTHVLRARIDMASPNLNMRDPTLYRIRKASHHRTGDGWCIYPMYDYAHCVSDSIEGITHSLCTLEFEDHRALYDWILDELEVDCHPQQIEFARLNLSHTVMSKRRLAELVQQKLVDGWDDPRMPTLAGLRRRGYTPEAIRSFCDDIGVAKRDGVISLARLEYSLREDLNRRAPRAMGVLHPLRVVIENYPEGEEELEAVNNPEDPGMGSRRVPFSRTLYIERDDFREDPPRKFFRLAPGREVRLRYAYFIRCVSVVKDPETGQPVELRCTYDPSTRGGDAPDGRKVKATLHWVSASHAIEAEVRLYDRLFVEESPGSDYQAALNPDSLIRLRPCYLEPGLAGSPAGERFQLERLGYFCVDPDSSPTKPVLNRTATLRDSWARIERSMTDPTAS